MWMTSKELEAGETWEYVTSGPRLGSKHYRATNTPSYLTYYIDSRNVALLQARLAINCLTAN